MSKVDASLAKQVADTYLSLGGIDPKAEPELAATTAELWLTLRVALGTDAPCRPVVSISPPSIWQRILSRLGIRRKGVSTCK